MPTPCWIYKSLRKDQMYLYVAQQNDFDQIPAELLRRMGALELVMDLQLGPDTRLARENIQDVLDDLEQQGYHLQLPPQLRPELYFGE